MRKKENDVLDGKEQSLDPISCRVQRKLEIK